jgi:hypothetical protein
VLQRFLLDAASERALPVNTTVRPKSIAVQVNNIQCLGVGIAWNCHIRPVLNCYLRAVNRTKQ